MSHNELSYILEFNNIKKRGVIVKKSDIRML